ncbi:GldM family protein [Marinifilum sp. D714]|uniref:GldM family protein n=1 Tax=Marinifilum sp. D714 TaxID=2937523 RepID=UPI0027BED83C|nr:GldM family protein [Marinifilum sp. D714]MDQ2178802.1 hypothetical protein [Marinifilum sp. D714]
MNFTNSLLYSLTVSICLLTARCNSSKYENVKQEKTDVKTENKLAPDIKTSTPETTHVTKENKSGEQVKQKLPLYASISASKMNVLYDGVDNPVEINVPGIPINHVNVQVTNAFFRRVGNVYMINPRPGSAGRKCIVKVSAKIQDEWQVIDSKYFRIKRIPNPISIVAGKTGGKIRKNRLLVESGIYAKLTEDFDFDTKFTVTQFTLTVLKGGYTIDSSSRGYRFTSEQKELIKSLSLGSRVFIHNIKAVGPDKIPRNLGSLVFTID